MILTLFALCDRCSNADFPTLAVDLLLEEVNNAGLLVVAANR